jgi:hypothetical protein
MCVERTAVPIRPRAFEFDAARAGDFAAGSFSSGGGGEADD